jgi:hypothetical protein
MSPKLHAAFWFIVSVVVATAVGWGFYLVGSPATRRIERFDEQRLEDLQTIAREIRFLCVDTADEPKLKEALPKTLAEAAERARNQRINPGDPETGEPYRYRVIDEKTYELCATFSGARDWDVQVFWNHPAGEHCFTINVLAPLSY